MMAETGGGATISSVMNGIKDKFKNEDEEAGISPFQGLDKASVLQETKMFSDANTVTRNPRKCCQLITKLLHILSQGEPFTSTETTDVFFGVTKLFQSKDSNLRRMMYLFIKEVAEATAADEVIIVTQSLTKDMNSDVDLYRANAIRVLCRIIDGSMLTAIERYIKQAIVDKNNLVASSALVSGIHLVKKNPEVIRRWVNEVQEVMNSQYEMVQYHAVSLMYEIKQHDKLAVAKFVTQLQKQTLRSPLATCLLIRYTAKILQEDMMSPNATQLYAYLEQMLRHKSDMVTFEAAKAICALPIDARDLSPAINVLQVFLTCTTPTLRFAAVRTLSQVAMTQPMIVAKCNEDMETLISDQNRSIATLAITTLLKTGAESSVDRLMKQISSFMNEIADEFKIVVVEAIQSLCLKYPQKHRVLMNFLSNFLREEGGFEFKQTVTDALLFLIDRIPESKEVGLLHLCEFIEDCEFSKLSCKILHILGEKGPTAAAPARYIRFIYNRVILESACVRASAVSALAQFAIRVESIRASIVTLLQRCLQDDEDEVRDRAVLYLGLISSTDQKTFSDPLPMTSESMLRSIEQYKLRPSDGPVTFETLPHVAAPTTRRTSAAQQDNHSAAAISSGTSSEPVDMLKNLYAVSEFADFGPVFHSSDRIQLSEAETEYVVTCIKHAFNDHLVLEFEVLNTVNEQMLKDVTVGFEMSSDEAWAVHSIIPLQEAVYGEKASCYIALQHVPDMGYPLVSMEMELKFKVHEVDSTGEPDEEGFDEDYPLEPIELCAADLVKRVVVPDFRSAWEQIGDEAELREKYALQYKTVKDGVDGVTQLLGLQPCDNTGTVQPRSKSHILLLSGVFLGGVKVLVKSKLTLDQKEMVLQMAIRSEDPAVSEMLSDCIR